MSNDYLNLSNHSFIKRAFIKGIQQYGCGSSGSPLLSGYFKPHRDLEEKFAEFLNYPRGILFNSGYLANLSVITTFADRQKVIIADKFCHASLLAGMQLCRAKLYRYPHQQINALEELLSRHPHALVITESVFSMQGDVTPLAQISALAKKYQAHLIVDDAHGFGVLGKEGKGISEYAEVKFSDLVCLICPLGKALASQGAIVVGEELFIDALFQFSSPYRYSTALPPAVAVSTLAALNILQKENWRITRLQTLIKFFIHEAHLRGLEFLSNDRTPIKCLVVHDNAIAIDCQKAAARAGFLIANIRPPTVPVNKASLRISLQCEHCEKDILCLLDFLTNYLRKKHAHKL